MIIYIKDIFKLCRLHHWVKNLFIFLPLFFSGHFFQYELLLEIALATLLFSLVASSIYIINDVIDADADRHHPEKKYRPIASGRISPLYGIIIAVFLLTITFTVTTLIFSFLITYLFIGYFLLNLLYTIKLKNFAILDIVIISIGFIIRITIGGAVAEVVLSQWIVLMTFLLSVFLALAKRRDDLIILETKGTALRKSLDGYNKEFVNVAMVMTSSIIVVCYIMYTISEDVVSRISNNNFYITSFFVVLGMLRYLQITFVESNSGSPTKILLTDSFTIVNILFWSASVFYFIYVH